jgi:hypothetical protein
LPEFTEPFDRNGVDDGIHRLEMGVDDGPRVVDRVGKSSRRDGRPPLCLCELPGGREDGDPPLRRAAAIGIHISTAVAMTLAAVLVVI